MWTYITGGLFIIGVFMIGGSRYKDDWVPYVGWFLFIVMMLVFIREGQDKKLSEFFREQHCKSPENYTECENYREEIYLETSESRP